MFYFSDTLIPLSSQSIKKKNSVIHLLTRMNNKVGISYSFRLHSSDSDIKMFSLFYSFYDNDVSLGIDGLNVLGFLCRM